MCRWSAQAEILALDAYWMLDNIPCEVLRPFGKEYQQSVDFVSVQLTMAIPPKISAIYDLFSWGMSHLPLDPTSHKQATDADPPV
jgi:hypothetical protein